MYWHVQADMLSACHGSVLVVEWMCTAVKMWWWYHTDSDVCNGHMSFLDDVISQMVLLTWL